MQPPRPAVPVLFRPGLWILLGLSLVLHAGLLAFGPGWYLALSASLHGWDTGAVVAAPVSPAVRMIPVQPLSVEPVPVALPAPLPRDGSALSMVERDSRKAPANAERPPVAKKRIAPAYPVIARRAQIEGRVVARVLVDEQGRVTRIDTIDGHVVFHEVVATAVWQWEFVPAMQGERAVSAWVSVPFVFRLEAGVSADQARDKAPNALQSTIGSGGGEQ